MSATILRELVSKVFQVRSKNVILSGEISPKATYGGNTCWSSQTTEQFYNVWGFCPTKGFVKLVNFVSNYNNNTDGSGSETEGCELHEVANVEDYVFFLVHDRVKAHDDRYCSSDWTLYKAPNFAAHWAKITDLDVTRWEVWLTNEAV